MKASCTIGHDRVECFPDHVNRRFVCPKCGAKIYPEDIIFATPPEYRSSSDPLLTTLQKMADYEIEAVMRSGGSVLIEYPRRGR